MILSYLSQFFNKNKMSYIFFLKNNKISTFQEHKLYKDFNTHNSLMNKKKIQLFWGKNKIMFFNDKIQLVDKTF
jgi:hypothetical protein